MATHFNAFISYRHSPLDSQIAQRIHRQLERFQIPKAIQKATGIKKIDRIFRDKEELPLSVNLSDDINEALIHSDYLIVICSPRFQQSQWCMREIELFLQTHPIERILIVLAEGEPDDVVPPILTQNREPLCCDYRMKPQKAKNIELPRLVSALLGCRYDDLRQRQRQYKMRRMVALFSAALVASLSLTAYFIHTSIQIQKANDDLHEANVQIQQANVQIRDNLDQALRNQSEYLAAAAGERMEAGDRLTAISLALAALPSEGNDRPYVPEAEQALSEALSSYQSEQQVIAQGAFATDALVDHYDISEDGEKLYILDARKVLTVWDTKTFRKLSTIDMGAYSVEQILLTAADNIIFQTTSVDDVLFCYRPDGTLLWQAEHCTDMAFLNDRKQIIMLQNDYKGLWQYTVVDADSGEPTGVSIPITYQEQESQPVQFLQLDNDAGRPVLVRYFSGNTDFVFLLDLTTGNVRKVTQMDTSLSGDNQSVDYAALDAQGNVILMRGDGSGIYNGNYGTFQVTSPDRADLICYDADSLKVKWQSEITTYIFSSSRTVAPIPESDRLLLQSGDVIQIHDSATGRKLSQCQLPAIPLYMEVESETAWGITQNGAYFSYHYGDDQCYLTPFSDSTLDGAVIGGGYFVHVPLESQVTVYRAMKDTEGIPYQGETTSLMKDCRMSGGYIADWASKKLTMIDTNRKKLLWQQELEYGWDLLDFSRDSTRLYMLSRYDEYVGVFSVEDGTRVDIPFSVKLDDRVVTVESDFFYSDDQLLYILETDGLTQLRRVDLTTGKETLSLELKALTLETSDYKRTTEFVLATQDYAWILREEALWVIDLHSGDVQQLLTGVTAKPVYAWDAARSELLMAVGHELLLVRTDGRITGRIDLGDKRGVSVFFYGSELLALCDDGAVYRYSRMGTQLSRTALHLYNSFFSNVSYGDFAPMEIGWWRTSDGELIVKAFGAGNIIDCGQWQCKAFVPQLCAYAPQQDHLICVAEDQLMAYSRYTTQQQMQKAREALGDFRLTEEQLKYYGLS